MKTIVIGAGISGLATAALLAKRGYSVTLLEKNSDVGGRAMVWKEMGFTFDMGPSWYQVPEAFEHFFNHFDTCPKDYFKLEKLDPQYKLFFNLNDTQVLSSDLEKNLKIFESYEKGSAVKIRKYLAYGKKQYDISMKHILYHNFNSLLDYMNPLLLPYLMQINIFENLERFVTHYTSSEKIKKMLLYPALFIGGDPKNMPALYSLMSYVDLKIGTYYPHGGIGIFIGSLKQLCINNGVKIVLNQSVDKIIVQDNRAIGVRVKDDIYSADTVVSCADYPFTELQLLDKNYQSYSASFWEKSTPSPSAFVIYLGLKKKIKNLEHHNLFLAENWNQHFSELFHSKKLPENPSYYISCPSKTDHTVAPENHENIFITVQIPYGISLTKKQQDAYFVKIISHLETLTGDSISQNIVVKRVFAAGDYNSVYNAYQNSAIGLASTFKHSLFRPQNKSKKLKNLFFSGQYTAPGAGMPMCLISAEKAVDRICKDFPV